MITSADIDKIFHGVPQKVNCEDEIKEYYENLYKEKLKSEYQNIYHKGVRLGKRAERRKKEKGITITRLAEELNINRSTLYDDIKKIGLGTAIKKRVLLEAVNKITEGLE